MSKFSSTLVGRELVLIVNVQVAKVLLHCLRSVEWEERVDTVWAERVWKGVSKERNKHTTESLVFVVWLDVVETPCGECLRRAVVGEESVTTNQ